MRYAFRKEDARAERAPSVAAEGFRPWHIATLEEARHRLRQLLRHDRLTQEVERWCLLEDRASSWFFNAYMDKEGTYGNGHCLYRINVRGLRSRPWEVAEIEAEAPKQLELYLDEATLDRASTIALVWLVPGRKRELLTMSPIGPDRIDRYHEGVWIRLGDRAEPRSPARASRDATAQQGGPSPAVGDAVARTPSPVGCANVGAAGAGHARTDRR